MCIEALLVACGGPTAYKRHLILIISLICYPYIHYNTFYVILQNNYIYTYTPVTSLEFIIPPTHILGQ